MRRVTAFALMVIACLLFSDPSAQAPGDMRVLDVAAFDASGKPVTDLARSDFQIEDDGKKVEIQSFEAVAADGAAEGKKSRSIVVVMDDVGVPASGTQAIQQIAQNVLSKMGPRDDIGIMNMHDTPDKLARDVPAVLQRLAAYQAGSIPFDQNGTTERMLASFAAVAQALKKDDGRRKAIVCVGSAGVCAIGEQRDNAPRRLWPNWVAAVGNAAAANVVIHAVIPARTSIMAGTINDLTGGEAFATTSDLDRVIDKIWAGLSNYYLIGYRAAPSNREVASITVRTNRKGIEIQARRRRGK
jgi:VWFA-related protein